MTTSRDHTAAAIEELRALVDTAQGDIVEQPTPIAVDPKPPVDKSVNRNKPELPAYLVAVIALIGIVVLTMTSHPVPEILNVTVIGALGIGGAVTTPKGAA